MSNNYTQFSVLLKIVNPEIVKAVSAFIQRIDDPDYNEEGEEVVVAPPECFTAEDVEFIRGNISDYGGLGGWDQDDGELHVYAEEMANLEGVAFILQKLLNVDAIKASYRDGIVVTWANTCSKMRPDEFSGGACYVTKDEIHWQPDVISWVNVLLNLQ